MTRPALGGVLILLALGGAGLLLRCSREASRPASPQPPAKEAFRSGVFEPPREAPDFELDGSTGSKLHLHDHLGKVIVLEFGFTFCTQVCPVTLANLAQAHRKLGAAAGDVQVIFVTVDPKRDTAERLKEYLAAFNPSFLGATGTPKALEAVRGGYGISAKEIPLPNDESAFDHSSFIYLIDRRGKIRCLVPFGQAPDDIAHDVGLLLKE